MEDNKKNKQKKNIVSISGLCFMQIGKQKQTKNLVVEYLLFEDACIFL